MNKLPSSQNYSGQPMTPSASNAPSAPSVASAPSAPSASSMYPNISDIGPPPNNYPPPPPYDDIIQSPVSPIAANQPPTSRVPPSPPRDDSTPIRRCLNNLTRRQRIRLMIIAIVLIMVISWAIITVTVILCSKPRDDSDSDQNTYTLPPIKQCEVGWSSFSGYCYKLFTPSAQLSYQFDSAKLVCQNAYNAHLVSILSYDEDQFVSGMIQSQFMYNSRIWIGLQWTSGCNLDYCSNNCNTSQTQAYPRWTDGSEVDYLNSNYQSSATFSNCIENNVCCIDPTQLCVYTHYDESNMVTYWVQDSCYDPNSFICKKPQS